MPAWFRRSSLGFAFVLSLLLLQLGLAGTRAQDAPSQVGPSCLRQRRARSSPAQSMN